MIKQFHQFDNQAKSQQPTQLELEERVKPVPWQNNEGTIPEPNLVEAEHLEILPAMDESGKSVVESVSSLPHQLYERLGLAMPRWLLWTLTAVVGIVLSSLLVSTAALWTPLWSNLERTDEELGFAGRNEDKLPLPGEIWGNLSRYKLSKPMNILIMGIEPVAGAVDGAPESFAASSDTMLLVRLNPSNKSMRVLSIPRDTMIALPEQGLTKVSDANAQGGAVLAARVVSRTLSNAPIHRYIRISTSGLRQLVDQLGGVDVFVPQDIEYRDANNYSSAKLVTGWQTLNGEQVEQFVRFREAGNGDLQRVQRQQAVIKALLQRVNSPTVMPKLPQLTRLMRKYFDTNLKLEEMMALANFSVNLEGDSLQMTILPGTFSRFSQDPNSYWLNLTGQQSLLDNYVGVNISGLKPDSRTVNQLKIAVQNASNQPHLREKVLNYLKQGGFTNVYVVPDWPDTQQQTQIIVRKGNKNPGKELREVLPVGYVDVSAGGDLDSDMTIRIGKDWQE